LSCALLKTAEAMATTPAISDDLCHSTASILRKYYASVKPLGACLGDLLTTGNGSSSVNNILSQEGDFDSYLNLLKATYVGVKQVRRTPIRVYSSMLDMREVRGLQSICYSG